MLCLITCFRVPLITPPDRLVLVSYIDGSLVMTDSLWNKWNDVSTKLFGLLHSFFPQPQFIILFLFCMKIKMCLVLHGWWVRQLSRYSDWIRAGRSGDRIPVEARFSAPVQTGLGANPASYKMGTGSFPGVKSGRGVTMTSCPLLAPWPRKSRAIPLLPLWAVRPVQSLSACTGVHIIFYLLLHCWNCVTVWMLILSKINLSYCHISAIT